MQYLKGGQLMFGIPYRRLEIKSPMKPTNISECLEDIVWKHTPYFWIGKTPKDKNFVGFLSSDSFRIQRIGGIWNTIWKPTFYGKVHQIHNGSEITITMTLGPIEFLFFLLQNLLVFSLLIAMVLKGDWEIASVIAFGGLLVLFNLPLYFIFTQDIQYAEREFRNTFLK